MNIMDEKKIVLSDNDEFSSTVERYERLENYNSETMDAVSANYKSIIELLEPEPNREGVKNTPERSAKAMQFLTHGYDIDAASLLREAMFKENHKHIYV